ncbi:MAG: ABC transporter ATP-binding protein [Thermoproteota archaeon]|nr:ABC transporter ATP-binding protein [Candidatus Brockarchaeota archaeon]
MEIVNVTNLIKEFPLSRGLTDILSRKRKTMRVLDNVSFSVLEGETLGLVGESGSGKTTLARILLGLIKPTSGKVMFKGEDIFNLRRLNKLEVHAVFQDPDSSLNPMMQVKDIIAEPLFNTKMSKKDVDENVIEILSKVGLTKEIATRYPFELSGGQKQRVAIARALIKKPKFIVLDEPTSALDVSIQAQLLNLLIELQGEFGLTYFFISHNMNVISYISDRIAVIYAGQLVELGTVDELISNPLHPYTKLLWACVPRPDPETKISVKDFGEVPSLINPPPGCRFHPRCPYAMEICKSISPTLEKLNNIHLVACHLFSRR